jgi:hypothetical protein
MVVVIPEAPPSYPCPILIQTTKVNTLEPRHPIERWTNPPSDQIRHCHQQHPPIPLQAVPQPPRLVLRLNLFTELDHVDRRRVGHGLQRGRVVDLRRGPVDVGVGGFLEVRRGGLEVGGEVGVGVDEVGSSWVVVVVVVIVGGHGARGWGRDGW